MSRKDGERRDDDARRRGRKVRSLVIGGLVGASAAAVTHRLRLRLPRAPRREAPIGLAAFESAPCYREASERPRADGA